MAVMQWTPFRKLFTFGLVCVALVFLIVYVFLQTKHLQVKAQKQEIVFSDTVAPVNTVDALYEYQVPVLVYHTIAPYTGNESSAQKDMKVDTATFEKQLIYLQDNGYTTMTFKDLADKVHAGLPVPEKTVVLTFDDGLDNQYATAFPLLKKYNMTATFFVYTIVVGHKKFMTWDNIIEIDKAGFEIASHTRNHENLQKTTDPQVLDIEITGSKKTIEEKIGHPVYTLAYPFYAHTESVYPLVKAAGYTAARAGWKKVPNTADQIYSFEGRQVTNNFNLFPSYLRY